MSKTAEIGAISIGEAQAQHADVLVEMFNDFRIFYGCEGDIVAARRFVTECGRFRGTRFFTAVIDRNIAGFMHLIPYVDTLLMQTAWILEDLFVKPAARNAGVGGALLKHAERFARNEGAARLTLTTAHTNATAQKLYEANGYVFDRTFRIYNLALT
jgi:GNAT superfamily N-acetyltransferase